MAMAPLILACNPGSASRKYALFAGSELRASLHFEWLEGNIVCSLQKHGQQLTVPVQIDNLEGACAKVVPLLHAYQAFDKNERIAAIGLRVVAPGSYFLQHRLVNDAFVGQLQAASPHAIIHAAASLTELQLLSTEFTNIPIIGVSDSAFHATKPPRAWNYGLPLEDADRLDIKRFGFHGLSAANIVRSLHAAHALPSRLIVCHLGSGGSITAILDGKSIDTTMGYSPLEGVIMATRSGNLDPTAAQALKIGLQLDDAGLQDYLNHRGGLLGLGGSADIRQLLAREEAGDMRAQLALDTYLLSIQKAIGQMAAALGGVDGLVFTGTVGERSAAVRARVVAQLGYLDLKLDEHSNIKYDSGQPFAITKHTGNHKPVFVIAANEAAEIALQTEKLI